jgi:hypothetical protein
MDQLDSARLASLRSQLVNLRSERNRLIREINSPFTAPARKFRATGRYASISADLRNTAAELEKLIAATKSALGKKAQK